MKRTPRIIRDNETLFQHYQELQAGDIISCRIRLKPGEEHILLDLSTRGLISIPSFTSQLCSRSKVFQARLFGSDMIPGTAPIYTFHDLLTATNIYGESGVEEVIVKQEGKNGGLGIFRFKTIEDVYTQSALGTIPYPYVLQPYLPGCRDLRVVIMGEYIETYERSNPHNFRNNLHCGGEPTPCELSAEQLELCKSIMQRGEFPYAHLDLMVTDAGISYFTEVNLRGGLRGARISSPEYQERIDAIHAELCEHYLDQ